MLVKYEKRAEVEVQFGIDSSSVDHLTGNRTQCNR